MDICYKCKKVFGSSETFGNVEGQKYCLNCLKCHKCRQNLTAGNFNRKDGDFWCLKCLKEENNSDKYCSFCKKELKVRYHSSPDKPGMMACDKCLPELKKPKDYDANAKAYCQCGKKTSTPTWSWNGNEWEVCAIVVCGGSCKRERERERERAKIFVESVRNSQQLPF